MDAVLLCLTTQHDPRLILAAGLVCLIGLATASSLGARAGAASGGRRRDLAAAAGAMAGLTVWTTHFVAMLGFRPGVPTGYDLPITAASFAVALGFGVGAAYLALSGSAVRRVLAAVVAASGVAAMHFLGMSGLVVPGVLVWDPVLASVAVAAGLAIATAAAFVPRKGRWYARALPALTATLGVCALHFIAMGAAQVVPDATVAAGPNALSEVGLLTLVALAAALPVVCAGVATALAHWGRMRGLKHIREAVDAMPDALGYYDADGRLVLWNERYAEVNRELIAALEPGMRFEDVLQVGLDAGIYADAVGREDEWKAERLAARRLPAATMEQRCVDGRWLRVQDRRTAGGGIVTIVNDITDLKLSSQALAEARDQAEAANAAKSQFLANMSHEIRTPLNGVVGLAQALSRTQLDEDQREMLELMQASSRMLQTLLDDILDLARIESGRMSLAEEPFELGRTVHEAADLYCASAAAKGLTLIVDVAEDCPGWVKGDAVRLKQVLCNLVSNAVKFTEAGLIRLETHCGPEDCGAPTLRFAVTDTGIGFDSAQKDRLFGRFEQADGAITRRFGGSGLGLAICRQLAEMMGGSLDAESEPGGGSTFILCVPLVRAEAPAARPAEVAEDEATRDRVTRVLLADDHPTNRKVVELILGAAAVDLTSVEDGAQALSAYQDGVFDLVLMDMQMPVMDGLSATRAIRAHERETGRVATPIVMLTANALPEHVAAAREAGADRHLAKPFEAAELLALVSAPAGELRQAA